MLTSQISRSYGTEYNLCSQRITVKSRLKKDTVFFNYGQSRVEIKQMSKFKPEKKLGKMQVL